MSLLTDSFESAVFLEKHRTPDGEGGFTTVWTESEEQIKVSITFNSSIQAKIGDKLGVTSLYKITTFKGNKLEYHDVLKRLSDGKIFRVTSDGDDVQTPKSARFGQYLQVDAEEWLPS